MVNGAAESSISMKTLAMGNNILGKQYCPENAYHVEIYEIVGNDLPPQMDDVNEPKFVKFWDGVIFAADEMELSDKIAVKMDSGKKYEIKTDAMENDGIGSYRFRDTRLHVVPSKIVGCNCGKKTNYDFFLD